MPAEGEGILRLIFALFSGGLIGYERKRMAKPAGTRTHALVSVGACLFGLTSLWMGDLNVSVDASRIASQVVVGIGFIGAGAIISYGGIVKGLTTAATLWISAALGLSIGLGLYIFSLSALFLVVLTLLLTPPIEKRILRRKYILASLHILSTNEPSTVVEIHRLLEEMDIGVYDRDFEQASPQLVELIYEVHFPPTLPKETIIQRLESLGGVHRVKISTSTP